MAAGKVNIAIEQYADFRMRLTLKKSGGPIDLTGHVFKGQIRKTTSNAQPVANFEFDQYDQAAADNMGRVDVVMKGDATGKIPCDQSSDVERKLTQFAYDIYSRDPQGREVRWLQGIVTVSPSATKPVP